MNLRNAVNHGIWVRPQCRRCGGKSMKARRELRTGLRLLVMALVFLAISCEDDGDGDGCLGDTDGLITGCSDGCGTDVWMIKGDGCLSDCIFDGDGCNLTGEGGCGDCGGDGCGDCGGCGSDAPYDYGDGKVVESAVQIHVTDSLFAFVKRKLVRSEEHTSELQSRGHIVCRLLL